MEILLPILMLAPLVLGLLLASVPRGSERLVGVIALAETLLVFAISLAVAAQTQWWDGGFTEVTALPWIEAFGLRFGFGLDAVSLWLVLLTTFLMPLVVLGSFSAVHHRVKEFYIWLMVLESAMIGSFLATDLIFFYICFEFTLVPLYFLIGIFGSKDRLRAARVFFLYTFTGSMITFAGLLYVAWFNASRTGAWSFYIPQLYEAARAMSPAQQSWLLLALLAGFAVKVPLFPVHTWLPLAHTEAPTAGSVILAGVLLKLGTYGLLRFALPMTPDAVAEWAPWIGVFAVIGILYAALVCWVQKDIKKLIAYSSVSHLGFCVLGMFALNTIGLGGSVMYMINHGLATGALFLCVGMIYERFHTRQMADMSGLGRVMPIWAFFMVFFVLASVALPGLNGFVSEFLTLLGAFTSDSLGPWFAAAAGVGMILGAVYILYMVGRVVWGPLKVPQETHGHGPHAESDAAAGAGAHHGHAPTSKAVHDLSWREIATLVPLAAACLWLGLYPSPVLRSFEPAIKPLAAPAQESLAARRPELVPAAGSPRWPEHSGTDINWIGVPGNDAPRLRVPALTETEAGR